MKKMISVFAVPFAALAFSASASAACYGTGSFQNCYDSNTGNSYNVQRFGNTTRMNGYNAGTGSTWNQTSQTFGNTTYHRGTAANGNSWNSTQRQIGGTTYYSGTDSRGNSFNCSKSQYFSTC